MDFCSVNFRSKSLKTRTTMDVLLPEAPGPRGVLYLLHGLGDDQTCWRRNVPLGRCAERLGMILVMPYGGRGYYANAPGPMGEAWEDHIVRDVVGFVDRNFPARADRQGRAVAGASMGGYGAMMLALKHPEVFSAVSSMSGSLYFCSSEHPRQEEYPTALMTGLPADRYGCHVLAKALAGRAEAPAIRFDCGRSDHLLQCNRDFHAHLQRHGIAHEYHEHEGGHDWRYWNEHICDTLAFAARLLAGR